MLGVVLAGLASCSCVAALAAPSRRRCSCWLSSSSAGRSACARRAPRAGAADAGACSPTSRVRLEGPADHAAARRRRRAAAGAAVGARAAPACSARAGPGPRRAGRWLAAPLPLLAPLLLLAAVILLGVRPARSRCGCRASRSRCWRSAWLAAARRRRAAAPVTGGSGRPVRLVTGAVLLGVAGALALPVGTWAAGGDDATASCCAAYVEPPFDVGQYPSPLSSFRRYVELPQARRAANLLRRRPCSPSRARRPAPGCGIATLDHYDGVVWGATNDAHARRRRRHLPTGLRAIDNPVEGTGGRRRG